MHFFSQYRGLRRENYVLFFGRIVTNMGSMVWPMLTMILNQKLGMSAGNIAILTAVFGILMMPAGLKSKFSRTISVIFSSESLPVPKVSTITEVGCATPIA